MSDKKHVQVIEIDETTVQYVRAPDGRAYELVYDEHQGVCLVPATLPIEDK